MSTSDNRVTITFTFRRGVEEKTYNAEFPLLDSRESDVAAMVESAIELRKSLTSQEYLRAFPDPSAFLDDAAEEFNLEDLAGGAYYDRINASEVWFEITSTIANVENLLADARAYKELEPPYRDARKAEEHFEANDELFRIHLSKMEKFNLAVFYISKIEDLVVRLIYESLGGSLVRGDHEKGWEKVLTWDRMRDALSKEGISAAAGIPEEKCRELIKVFSIFKQPDFVGRFTDYRDRLAHRLTPPVDYSEFAASRESRVRKPLVGASGYRVGSVAKLGTRLNHKTIAFLDIYRYASRTLEHYVSQLRKLKTLLASTP